MPESGASSVLVTGANGHIGRRLLTRMAEEGTRARAIVRSKRAAATIEALPTNSPDLRIVDYADTQGLAAALQGCRAAVHLVGVIKETRSTPFEAAHEIPCEALCSAAESAGIEHLVYLSIVGSDPASSNACFASRGRAEEVLLRSPIPTTIVRVPMVLGPGDYASAALRGQATGRIAALIGGGRTLQQPIDAADVVSAILACLAEGELRGAIIDLGGPDCLSHRELVLRAAELYDQRPTILPIPRVLVRGFAGLISRVNANPPITAAMLGVLQHDDRIDSAAASKRLGIQLTPLDTTLRSYVGPGSDLH